MGGKKWVVKLGLSAPSETALLLPTPPHLIPFYPDHPDPLSRRPER